MTLEGKKYSRDHKIMAKSVDKEDIGNEDSLILFSNQMGLVVTRRLLRNAHVVKGKSIIK